MFDISIDIEDGEWLMADLGSMPTGTPTVRLCDPLPLFPFTDAMGFRILDRC